ncbi:helix-turn-helix transcriptional regulator [Paracoccus sp. SCSIO 75233]|uniref:helix-turn-helix domain-containing protein n=1 Tax=Paracoccus sp. SCSIO 75233 TaxID=3017782 RepID=UPI0022F0CEE7|nr:helix-turn-helix transcriptional regulator [Paracoccus sp. SCSIO 75233]WBU52074.1 helix-turn-helix transcriptional regulator [Paracoccus sp. SCSIO 75233]
MSREHWPLGLDLKARRQAKGWTQRQLAKAAGIGRTAVQYWEGKLQINPHGWAVECMADALRWDLAQFRHNNARARDGVLSKRAAMPEVGFFARLMAEQARRAEREAERAATRRVICGAKTRKGTPCRMKSEPGKNRCKFHGGKSTGARTPEGIERIREAQRRRWAKVRQEREARQEP